MKGKVIIIVICIYCLITSTITFASELNDVIIVDDEGDGDYTSIKEALSYAKPGDTIEVYSGTYYEYGIWINKEGISLRGIPYELGTGNDTGKPFINGEGLDNVFIFNATDITLDGFHIENKDGTQHDIIDVVENADGCTISNNDLRNTSICFIYIKSSYNKILNNTISYSLLRMGIVLREPSKNNIVKNNTISECLTGILTWGSGFNLIEGNNVHNCERFGLDIGYYFNTVQYNNVENNTVGIQLMSVGTRVFNNNFINNEEHAIGTYGRFRHLISNRWNGNYWGAERNLPYPIPCSVFIFPSVQFDWRPASSPNVIEL